MMVIGRKILRYDIVTSTNDLARDLAADGEPEGLVIMAEEQTSGRGRLGRRWVAPYGSSIQVSVLLRPDLPANQVQQLTQAAGLAVVAALYSLPELANSGRVALKWPNDVLLNGKKCAGILTETSFEGERLAYAIIGIGLNVNFSMAAYPDLRGLATTLSDELGHTVEREPLENALLSALDHYYSLVRQAQSLREEYRGYLAMLGKTIRVRTEQGIIEGTAQDVASDGALVLATPHGDLRLLAGDVTILAS